MQTTRLRHTYSDLVGNHRFGHADVLISKLLDTNRDGKPSKGDTIIMGKYPTRSTPRPTDFADWELKRHTVGEVSVFDADRIVFGEDHELFAGDPYFRWYRHSSKWHDEYQEGMREAPQALSVIEDEKGSGSDTLFINIDSPSQATSIGVSHPGTGDDRLIDVEIYS